MVGQRDAAAARVGCEQQFAAAEQLQLERIALLKMQQLAEGLRQSHRQHIAPAADVEQPIRRLERGRAWGS